MGNEALGRGLVESGCSVVTSYPGTPASEILSSVVRYTQKYRLKLHTEWSVNEKAAFEVALSNSYMGGRSAVAMKQVGLNVASDSLMSSAYTGIRGGFLVIAADDPGPHSSQTEQDSRFMAMFAKIPVLDPSSPREAYEMTRIGMELSEKYCIPVMIRLTTRVCHARQNIATQKVKQLKYRAKFIRDPQRWAATPKFRLKLHRELNAKLQRLSAEKKLQPVKHKNSPKAAARCGILCSGVAYAYMVDLLTELGMLDRVALYKVSMPYPLADSFLSSVTARHARILVVEETYPVIEMQLSKREGVNGRLNGFVPRAGELTPDILYPIVLRFLQIKRKAPRIPAGKPEHRPSLCAGCPHRASFFAVKKALPKALYPGDIGCYTLGINMGAVDTCLCMGASINQAAGFFHAYAVSGSESKPIVAAIGDSTFMHAGIPALINAVYHDARFILLILDNGTTAMTGNQPTAATGILADGTPGRAVDLETLLKGCGLSFVRVVDPYDVPLLIAMLKEADSFTRQNGGGIAALIARRACLLNERPGSSYSVQISEQCTNCRYCITSFECPALETLQDKVVVNATTCTGCGVCAFVCPIKAIKVDR